MANFPSDPFLCRPYTASNSLDLAAALWSIESGSPEIIRGLEFVIWFNGNGGQEIG